MVAPTVPPRTADVDPSVERSTRPTVDALGAEALGAAGSAEQGVGATRGLLAAHQDVVGGLEEEQRRRATGDLLVPVGLEAVEERPRPDVDDDRDANAKDG